MDQLLIEKSKIKGWYVPFVINILRSKNTFRQDLAMLMGCEGGVAGVIVGRV